MSVLVWITRAEPGAGATAARVAGLGLTPLVAPLLTVRGSGAALDLQPLETLAFTSSQGLLHLPPDLRRDRRVFAVGDATAEAARRAGFTDVLSADGDVEALAALILASRPAAVVHPAADRTAGDLVRRLTDAGLAARRVTVYRAEAADALPPSVAQAVRTAALSAVLIYSPRAGEIAAALIAGSEVDVARVEAFGLSAACLQPLAHIGFRRMTAAPAPTEDALMARLHLFAQERPNT